MANSPIPSPGVPSPLVTLPSGIAAAGMHAGIKRNGNHDLGLLLADQAYPARVLFTKNRLQGAHIPVAQEHLRGSGHLVRAILVNSGNANCATGEAGIDDCRRIAAAVATELACPTEQVLFCSTGVIGARLPAERILTAVPHLVQNATPAGLIDFAKAIMTTDRHHKALSRTVTGDEGDTVTITGVAKGAGMVHPDMATMLAFLMTDGHSTQDMRLNLRNVAARSFHCLTVDGDTSPNDTVVLWSTQRHWCRPVLANDGVTDDPFTECLTQVAQTLCRQIARDAEGATRLVTIEVSGALSELDAATAARAIGRSLLVKTALFGRDPNWGRIISAVGSTNVRLEMSGLWLRIGDALVFSDQQPHPEREAMAAAHLRQSDEIVIAIHLGAGPYSATGWTCDLSPDYVHINADYRS